MSMDRKGTAAPRLSSIARALGGSQAVERRRRADDLAARGVSIVDFGMGEPDFAPPPPVVEAAIAALNAGETHYVDPRGLTALRERIAAFETARHGHQVGADRVVVTSGSFCALSITTRALLDPGDEVLIPEPHWGPYRAVVRLAGAVPVSAPAAVEDGRFAFDARRWRSRVGPRTRAVVINSPNNPSGRVLDPAELAAIAELALEHDLWIVADEVYSELVFGGARHRSIAGLGPEIADRTVIVTSFSKTFAMTGWRLGYCIAPAATVETLGRINHYTVRCATSFVQQAALTAFDAGLAFAETMRRSYAERRDLVAARLGRLPGVRCAAPEGTFYAFPELPAEWGDGTRVADRLLGDAGVVVSPGGAYGESVRQHIRISFATSQAAIQEGFDRIERWTKTSHGRTDDGRA